MRLIAFILALLVTSLGSYAQTQKLDPLQNEQKNGGYIPGSSTKYNKEDSMFKKRVETISERKDLTNEARGKIMLDSEYKMLKARSII